MRKKYNANLDAKNDTVGRIFTKLIFKDQGYLVNDFKKEGSEIDYGAGADLVIKLPTDEVKKDEQVTLENCDYIVDAQVLNAWKTGDYPYFFEARKDKDSAFLNESHYKKFLKFQETGLGGKFIELTLCGDHSRYYVLYGDEILKGETSVQFMWKRPENFQRVYVSKDRLGLNNPFFLPNGSIDITKVQMVDYDLYFDLMGYLTMDSFEDSKNIYRADKKDVKVRIEVE